MIGRIRGATRSVAVALTVLAGLSAVPNPANAQIEGNPRLSSVTGYIEFEGGGRPTERLEIFIQTPAGNSRFRIFSELGGTFTIRNLRPGTYEIRVPLPHASPYQDGFAEVAVYAGANTGVDYTVTVFLRRKDGPAFGGAGGIGGRMTSAQESDAAVAKEAKRAYRRGVDAALAQKTEEAIAQFRRALEIEPAYLFALNDLGVQLIKTQAYEEAIRILHRAIEIAPRSFPPHLNMALALLSLGRNDDAAGELQLAIEIDPSAADAYFLTGVIERRRQNREAAIASFSKAFDLGGADVILAQYELGELYQELNQPEAALRAYRLFLQFVTRGPKADRARLNVRALEARA